MDRIAMVLFVLVNTALAGPVVIYDDGRTQPIAPYLEPVTVKRPALIGSHSNSSPAAPLKAGFNRAALLPVRTPEMTPGELVRQPLTPGLRQYLSHLGRPVFLIGSDSQSLQWLARYREQLQTLGAVGMLIQAETQADLTAVDEFGKGLIIAPASASMLAKLLGLRHYPVLISREGIEQ